MGAHSARKLRPIALVIAVLAGSVLLARSGEAASSGDRQRALLQATATVFDGSSITLTTTPSAMTGATQAITGTGTASVTPTAGAFRTPTATRTPDATPGRGIRATLTATKRGPFWAIRSVDTMKLSRDTLKHPISDAQIAAIVRLDAQLHVSHITVDVYYDDPAYMGRWVRAIRAVHLKVWFRPHWYAWESHREVHGDMTPSAYVQATRRFLQQNVNLIENGDIFDFCPEPENGAYWFDTFGSAWSWRNPEAKVAFNSFIRSGLYMARTTLANRGRGGVTVTAISVNESVARRLLSKPTATRLGMITLDLYPEGSTTDPATATKRLLTEIANVHARWHLPILLGEQGYSRDRNVSDRTQTSVIAAEMAALQRVPYVLGLNYWVDAGGPHFGGYTNLYSQSGGSWKPRPAAAVLGKAFAAMSKGK